ncbi:4Fe-4S dicluster domain-containing protein [Palleronia sp. KMU-117]|uniref:4Fe-4S dicluster domain-containing protein n=1 Tax=Palleronia sp. KMU-117 TaxID=3434108 RepID=UPI003D7619ED
MTGAVLLSDPRDLLAVLLGRGFRVIAPQEADGVIAYAPLSDPDGLPRGRIDEQSPGSYRLTDGDPERWFDQVVGPGSWKAWLYPARRKLWSAERSAEGLRFDTPDDPWPETVFFGVRPCELAAMERQDDVFGSGPFADGAYGRRRAGTLVVVVQCARAAETCFCASMGTGPRADAGFDLAITELASDAGPRLLVESGSDAGQAILADLAAPAAADDDLAEARRVADATARAQVRHMPAEVAEGLPRRPGAAVWDEIATRCLACANCTLACPTCFCSDVEETSDLTGEHAERWRVWDSCFSADFSYIHGGSVRPSTAARYRQWMTHKLAWWHDQFGASGCVGCGRCITWCPVGIDIVAEATAVLACPEE